MIASIPINWFFTVSIAELIGSTQWITWLLRTVNLVVFTGVGIAMIDVFGRVMQSLEPSRGRTPTWWLVVVGMIGTELFYVFGLFDFVVASG